MMVWMLARRDRVGGAHVQLGLGAGAIRASAASGSRCDAPRSVNPRVVDVCRQWFGLPPPAPGFGSSG
jgi:hypothetical protein